jgi:hypothetical protein
MADSPPILKPHRSRSEVPAAAAGCSRPTRMSGSGRLLASDVRVFGKPDVGERRILLVHWPLWLALFTVLIGCVFDPTQQPLWPPPINTARASALLLSPYLLGCALSSAITLRVAWITARNASLLGRAEHFAMVWWAMNASWFQTGCDILSGLFAVMPNLSDCYEVLNADHKLPMMHRDRAVMDCVYWLELLVQVPLALLIIHLYRRRDPARYVVESFTSGMHFGGLVAYYIPDLVLGESTSFITNLDRCIACAWIVVPFGLLVRSTHLARLGFKQD